MFIACNSSDMDQRTVYVAVRTTYADPLPLKRS